MSLVRRTVESIKRVLNPPTQGIVLALGGGGAAGMAHIGVLQVLSENGIAVRAIAGTSIGAEIGAFVAVGKPVDDIARLATSFDWKRTLSLFLPDLPTGGLVSGVHITEFLRSGMGPSRIEDLPLPYVAIACDLLSGEQVVLDRGDLVSAVRASIAMPGIIAPHEHEGRFLSDGGVVNPLPVDVARQRFGGPVVAVAVHAGALGLRPPTMPVASESQWVAQVRNLLQQPWMAQAEGLRQWLEGQINNHSNGRGKPRPYWTARRVLDRVYEVSQTQLVQLRTQMSAPDLVMAPDVEGIGVLEFYRAREAIEAGRRVTEQHLPRLRQLAGLS